MSRVSKLIKEIRDRLNELESLLNPSQLAEIRPIVVDISTSNFRISDSSISFNETDFQISKPKLIELCNLIVKDSNTEINIKPFVETIDPNRCNSYCIVKEIPRREKFLKEDENLYKIVLSNVVKDIMTHALRRNLQKLSTQLTKETDEEKQESYNREFDKIRKQLKKLDQR